MKVFRAGREEVSPAELTGGLQTCPQDSGEAMWRPSGDTVRELHRLPPRSWGRYGPRDGEGSSSLSDIGVLCGTSLSIPEMNLYVT